MPSQLLPTEARSQNPAGSPLAYAINQRDRDVLNMVENALRQKRAMLAFQPVVLAKDDTPIAFYEGLIRIMDDTGRIIPARDFINVIETHEIGRVIDCLALEKGFEALLDEPSLRLSINMSARSVGYLRWIRTLENGFRKDPTAAERLILEITETSAMLMPELVISFMEELQKQGVSFALDDFGSGYTAFRHLRDFYFDIIKIDGQFIRGVHNNPDNQILTKALIGIAKQFEMFTVAESVESADDVAFLAETGIDCMQGYYFGAPTTTPPWQLPRSKRTA